MIERKTFIPFGIAADAPIDYLLGILEDARITTLERIENLPLEELHWQFAPGWNTIGALLSHIHAVEDDFRIEFVERRELSPAESERLTPGLEMGKFIPQLITTEPVSAYVERLNRSRERMLAAIGSISREQFFERREGYNPATGYNLAWALYHMAEDEVHHRGQISILRKLYAARER